PASFKVTRISVLFASILFSTNSFTTDAGLSTTSPAAILFAKFCGSCLIFKRKYSSLTVSLFYAIHIIYSLHPSVSFLINLFLVVVSLLHDVPLAYLFLFSVILLSLQKTIIELVFRSSLTLLYHNLLMLPV